MAQSNPGRTDDTFNVLGRVLMLPLEGAFNGICRSLAAICPEVLVASAVVAVERSCDCAAEDSDRRTVGFGRCRLRGAMIFAGRLELHTL